jgi:hypothetical protein
LRLLRIVVDFVMVPVLANTETQTNQYGHFIFHALSPGEYTLSISEKEQSPNMLTIKVGLNDGQHSTVLVRLDSAE